MPICAKIQNPAVGYSSASFFSNQWEFDEDLERQVELILAKIPDKDVP